MKENYHQKFEINVHRYNYREDSVRRSMDLTEVEVDTIWLEILELEEQFSGADSAATAVVYDSTTTASEVVYNEETEEVLPQYELRYTYHNDRTMKQANALVAYFFDNGLPEELFHVVTSKTEEAPPRGVNEVVVTLKML